MDVRSSAGSLTSYRISSSLCVVALSITAYHSFTKETNGELFLIKLYLQQTECISHSTTSIRRSSLTYGTETRLSSAVLNVTSDLSALVVTLRVSRAIIPRVENTTSLGRIGPYSIGVQIKLREPIIATCHDIFVDLCTVDSCPQTQCYLPGTRSVCYALPVVTDISQGNIPMPTWYWRRVNCRCQETVLAVWWGPGIDTLFSDCTSGSFP